MYMLFVQASESQPIDYRPVNNTASSAWQQIRQPIHINPTLVQAVWSLDHARCAVVMGECLYNLRLPAQVFVAQVAHAINNDSPPGSES